MKAIMRLLIVAAFTVWIGTAHAVPITGTDIVTVNGRDWAQVDLFVNLSWNEINAYCPAGVCGTGRLNGYDMEGWLWASLEDINDLGNYYIGSPELGPGHGGYGEVDSSWGPQFFTEWRHLETFPIGVALQGWVSSPILGTSTTLAHHPRFSDTNFTDQIMTFHNSAMGYSAPDLGAWFFRDPNAGAPVPSPPMIPLMALGLLILCWASPRKT